MTKAKEKAPKLASDPSPADVAAAEEAASGDSKVEQLSRRSNRRAKARGTAKRTFPGSDDVNLLAPLLNLSAEDLAGKIDPDADDPVPEEKVAGLLKLERSGQNRTDHVKVLCERLGVDSPLEVTHAGPPYTNDTRPVTKL